MRIPTAVRRPFTVYVNGVLQQPGTDYDVDDEQIVFARELVQEGRLGFWRWFLGAWGIGTYRKDHQVDVAWTDSDGHPHVAHKLPLIQSIESS